MGIQLGAYRLGPEIGRGAMGVVYRASDSGLNREVAVKIILAGQFASTAQRRRFLAEAEHAARLDHPNIVPIYQTGETEGRPWFAMKWMEGGTLASNPGSSGAGGNNVAGNQSGMSASTFSRPTLEKTARTVIAIARAVQHAHDRGVLHRDLKPGNILLDRAGNAHIADFGLARLLGVESSLTREGSPVGTPGYMAPELVRGDSDATTAADVWSLGAILYELLAGRPSFTGGSVPEVMRRILEEEPPSLGAISRSAADLEVIARKCLRKEPGQRYPSAGAVADDLERWLAGEPILARPASLVEKASCWARRRPLVSALAVALVVAIIGSGALLARINRHLATSLTETRRAENAARTHLQDALLARVRARRGVLGTSLEDQTVQAIAEIAKTNAALDTRIDAVIALAARDLRRAGTNAAPNPVYREFAPSRVASLGCSLDISPDGRIVVVGSHAGLDFWEVGSGRHLTHQRQNGQPWMSANFAPDGKHVVFSSRLAGVRSVPLEMSETPKGIRINPGESTQIGRGFDATIQAVFRGGRDWLVAMDRDPIYVIKAELWPDGDPAQAKLVAEGKPMTFIALSPDRKWLASALLPAVDVRVWDATTAKPLRELGLHAALLTTFTPDSRYLLTRDTSEYAVWTTGTWQKIGKWPARTTSLAARIRFSPDERYVAVLQDNDRVQILSRGEWQERVTLISPLPLDMLDMTWNAAGDRFYLLTREGQVREWNLAELRRQLREMGLDWEP